MQSNYLNQSNQQQQQSTSSSSSSSNYQNGFYSNNNNNNQTNSPQQFGGGGNGLSNSNNNNNQWGNGSPNNMRNNNNNNSMGSMGGNNNQNNNYNNSPFGGGGNNQSQYGAGGGGGGQAQNNPLPSAFGEKVKKNYLPGYLSGGALGAQSEAIPPQHDDSRTWDSPGSRASISGSSPIARFGNQSLFGNRDGTPSRSPQTNLYSQQPRTTAYRAELEEDAPPVESLAEYEAGNDSIMSQPSDSTYDNRRPGLNSTNSKSDQQPLSSSTSSSLPQGYSLHLFGFPSTSLPLILEHFSQFGEILSSIPSTQGGNWVTITYSSPTSAARASRKNGTIIGGILMIGVKVVDEEALKLSLGLEGNTLLGGLNGISDPSTSSTTTNSNNTSRPSTPSRGPPSGVGKPVSVLSSNSAFRSVAPTPPRRGFFASGAAGVNGTGGTPTSTTNGTGSVDPQAGLFAEKNRLALLNQGQQESGKGVLGKVSDLVFGW